MQIKRAFTRFILFALLGLLMEVFFGAAHSYAEGNWNLTGKTSPWMMLDYGLLGLLLAPISTPLIRLGVPLVLRAAAYMVLIFVVEYFSGLLFVAMGLRIWDYSHLPYNLHGQITLTYAPYWYALGFACEFLYKRIDAIAVLLIRGLTAEQVEKA